MDIKSTLAAQNYAQAKTAIAQGDEGGSGLKAAVQSFADVMNNHEDVARSAMMGQSDPHALVAALSSSQLAVETVVTLRNKVVEAYQEIIRMPV